MARERQNSRCTLPFHLSREHARVEHTRVARTAKMVCVFKAIIIATIVCLLASLGSCGAEISGLPSFRLHW